MGIALPQWLRAYIDRHSKSVAFRTPEFVEELEKRQLLSNTVIYSNDFQSTVGSEWSKTLTATTPSGRKFLGQFGGGNNATFGGTTGEVTWSTGHSGSAVQLDGAGGFIDVAPDEDLPIKTGAVTISAWVKFNDVSGTPVIAENVPTNGSGAGFIFGIQNSRLFLEIHNSSSQVFSNTSATGGTTLTTGQWYELTATFANGTITTYVNGVQDRQSSPGGTMTNGGLLTIGKRKGTMRYLNGALDDVQIFKRALSASEVASLPGGTTNGLIGYWKFDENTGTRTLDSSGAAGTTLTLTNLPTHASLTLDFDLFIIHSWDGRSTGNFGPDIWTLTADGLTLFNTTFANGNTAGQSYPGSYPGGNYPKQTGATEINTLGYGSPSDSVYHLSGSAPHISSSGSLTFTASDLEALSDESWGIDNVTVTADITTPSASGATSVDEGSAYTLNLDPGDVHPNTWTVDWGDGTQVVDGSETSVTHDFADGPGTYNIVATADDGLRTYTASGAPTVSVANVAPALRMASGGAIDVEPGISVSMSLASVTDPGFDNSGASTSESISAMVDWGDGSDPEAADVTFTAGSPGTATIGRIKGSHTYATAGTYTITVTATDDDGGTTTGTLQATVAGAQPYLVPGVPGQTAAVTLHMTKGHTTAAFHNELGLFIVNGLDAEVGGKLPGDAGYALAALNDPTRHIVFAPSDVDGTDTTYDLPSGSYVSFYLIQNNNSATFLAQNPDNVISKAPVAFFPNAAANPDNHYAHYHRTDYSDGTVEYDVEDLSYGGDKDFDDMVFTINGDPLAEVGGQISGRVTERAGDVPVTAKVDVDNHYGLYYGAEDGSGLNYVGRNEFVDVGSKGGYSWTDPETFNFRMPGDDYIYVAAWDGTKAVAMFMAEFDFFGNQSLLSNSTDWKYYIADPNSGDTGNVPDTSSLSSWITTANTTSGWKTSDAVTSIGIEGIKSAAETLWTTDFSDTLDNFVIFRAPLPTGLRTLGTGTITGVAGRTVFADESHDGVYSGTLDSDEPTAITDASGNYTLNGIAANQTVRVYEIVPDGWNQASPVNPTYYAVPVIDSQSMTGIDFITQRNIDEAPAIVGDPTASPATVTGTTTQLSATGEDDGGEAGLIYNWTLAGDPPASVTYSANGTNAAKITTVSFSKAGTYQFSVTAADSDGLSAVPRYVTVTVAQTLTSIGITPASVTVPFSTSTEDSTQQFKAASSDQFGDSMTTPTTIQWASSGGGTVDTGTGLYTAPTTGSTATVTATADGVISNTAAITLISAPLNTSPTIVTAASAAPSTVTGTTTQLSALGSDDGGEGNLSYVWSVVGTPPGNVTFSDNDDNPARITTVQFEKAGTYDFQVVATDAAGLISSASPVTVVVNQSLTALQVTPSTASIQLSTTANPVTQQFEATGIDQFGDATDVSATWSMNGAGTVNPTGLFTSPTSGENTEVLAAAGGETAAAEIVLESAASLLSATATSTKEVELTLPDLGAGTLFQIFRGNEADFQPTYENEVGETTSLDFKDDGVEPDTTYYYKAYALLADGSTRFVGTTLQATPLNDPDVQDPQGPSEVHAVGVNDLEILVSWKNNLPGAQGFIVEISTDPDILSTSWHEAGTASAGATNFLIRGYGAGGQQFLEEDATYYIRVSAYSSEVNAHYRYDSIVSASVRPPSINIDQGQDLVVVVGGNRQPMSYLLEGVSVSADGSLVGSGNSVGKTWVNLVNEGFNAFISADPYDGGSPSPGMPPFEVGVDATNDTLNNDGSGRLYDEMLCEIATRGTFDIGLIGYSHGGGMIYNISHRLYYDTTMPSFVRVVYAGTIDAVTYGVGADDATKLAGWYHAEPLEFSPASVWGADGLNYYENTGWRPFGLPLHSGWINTVRGEAMVGALNIQEPGLDHSSIAVEGPVLFGIQKELEDDFFQLSF